MSSRLTPKHSQHRATSLQASCVTTTQRSPRQLNRSGNFVHQKICNRRRGRKRRQLCRSRYASTSGHLQVRSVVPLLPCVSKPEDVEQLLSASSGPISVLHAHNDTEAFIRRCLLRLTVRWRVSLRHIFFFPLSFHCVVNIDMRVVFFQTLRFVTVRPSLPVSLPKKQVGFVVSFSLFSLSWTPKDKKWVSRAHAVPNPNTSLSHSPFALSSHGNGCIVRLRVISLFFSLRDLSYNELSVLEAHNKHPFLKGA